jgi:hypothetical protein
MIGWQVNDDEQTRINIDALSRIQTHGLSVQVIKAYAKLHGHWDWLKSFLKSKHLLRWSRNSQTVWNPKLNYRGHRPEIDESNPTSHSIALRSILILSSHLSHWEIKNWQKKYCKLKCGCDCLNEENILMPDRVADLLYTKLCVDCLFEHQFYI